MKAIRIHETGGSDVLLYEDVANPEPGPGELAVNVSFAGVNFIDTYHRSGLYPLELPATIGNEGAGTVTAVGDGIDTSIVGDRVAWTGVMGSYAEQVIVPFERAVPIPDGIATDVAAAAMLQGTTAHYLVTDCFRLEAGHACLVHAAAGGVGQLLVQLAVARGATVYATVGSAEKGRIVAALGAHHVINYREGDFQAAVEEIGGERPLDVVYDGVGQAVFDKSLDLLAPRGTMVQFGNASGPVEPLAPLRLAAGGSLFLTRPRLGDYVADRTDLLARTSEVFQWIGDGSLTIETGARFPLAEAARAHDELEGRRTTGKVLLEV